MARSLLRGDVVTRFVTRDSNLLSSGAARVYVSSYPFFSLSLFYGFSTAPGLLLQGSAEEWHFVCKRPEEAEEGGRFCLAHLQAAQFPDAAPVPQGGAVLSDDPRGDTVPALARQGILVGHTAESRHHARDTGRKEGHCQGWKELGRLLYNKVITLAKIFLSAVFFRASVCV